MLMLQYENGKEIMDHNAVEILLVEDTLSDAQLLLHAFKKSRLTNRIQIVRDGAEALEFLFCTGAYADRPAGDLPKLVLLDLKLPKVDGLEVLRRIKSDPRTRKTPVVVLTSSGEHPDIDKCYELGANSYIVKPVGFDQFVRATSDLGMYWLLAQSSFRRGIRPHFN